MKTMRLPDFLIIGAAKSGTTTLYKYLDKHPQVFFSAIKEPQFLALDEKYAKGIEWYASLFSLAQPKQVCGEASTDYTKFPLYHQTASRMAQVLPYVKMIYIMRHPVERAYSHYVHLARGKKVTETFEEHIQRTSVCLDTSNYILQIENYLQFFPKESFLFLLMEDLIDQPEQTLDKICHFINVGNEINLTTKTPVVANSRNKHFEDTIRAKITAPLRSIPGVATAATLLPQSWRDWTYEQLKKSFYGEQIRQQYMPPPMRSDTRQMLLEKFSSCNQKLAKFLDRDLSHWEI